MTIVQPMTTGAHRHRRAGLHVRLRQRLRDRGAARRAADRPQLAAALRLWPLCRAAHRARPSPRRARPTSGPGSIASARPSRIGAPSRRSMPGSGAPRPAPRSRCRSSRCAGTRSRSRAEGLRLLAGRPHHHHRGRRRRRSPAWRRMSTWSRARWRTRYFYNADAEMLFVPQQGALRLATEFGIIDIEPGEIAVIPRGVKFRVELPGGPVRGYLCENYGGALHPAGARPDRRQLPGQSARLPDPGRGL